MPTEVDAQIPSCPNALSALTGFAINETGAYQRQIPGGAFVNEDGAGLITPAVGAGAYRYFYAA